MRGFAKYLRTINPKTEIPPEGVLCGQPRRAIPYLYSDHEITRLLTAAGTMSPPLRAATFTTILGLLAVSGMRIGEALALDRDDVDLDAGILTVRDTKFGKSRQLPLHPTSTRALANYARVRDALCPTAIGESFFVSTHGSRPDKSTIQTGFRELRTAAGIKARPGVAAARLHDFRHSFAVRTLLDWHRTGVDVQARMLWLATYLGHCETGLELLVSDRRAGAARTRRRPLGDDAGGPGMTLLAPTLQAFFTERLMTQRQASPHTIAGYRDTMRLLLSFASAKLGKPPSKLEIDDLDAELITQFLVHLEQERGNGARTRNARLAAIHSLYRYAAFCHPEHAAVIERVLAIPTKRFDRALVNYLTKEEARALHRRPGPTHVDRPARPRAAPDRDPDRTARLRAHRPDLPRRPTRYRRAPVLPRQATQTTGRAAHLPDRQSTQALAQGTRRRACGSAVPVQPRRAAQP